MKDFLSEFVVVSFAWLESGSSFFFGLAIIFYRTLELSQFLPKYAAVATANKSDKVVTTIYLVKKKRDAYNTKYMQKDLVTMFQFE